MTKEKGRKDPIYKQIRQLINEGLGRRRIASLLGVTEWAARSLIREAFKFEKGTPKSATKKAIAPVRRSGKPNKLQRNYKSSGKPSIRSNSSNFERGANPIDSDIPISICDRDTSYRVAVVSDIHYPYEDANALAVTKSYLYDYNPNMIILDGDISDCYAVSSYSKSVSRKMNIQDEFDYTKAKLLEWVEEFPNVEFKYLEGNHESRLRRLTSSRAPELSALKSLSIPYNLCLEPMGIEYIPETKDLEIGKLTFMHGFRVRKNAGSSARSHFEDYGCSVIIGHCHRLSTSWRRNKYGCHAMIENGTLSDLDVEYARYPDWQLGFTTLNYDGDDFSVAQYAINNYKIITPTKVYAIK